MRDYCDGLNRRDALRVGAGAVGLTLESVLRRRAAAADKGTDNRRDDVSLIVLFLKGGLSTIDTLDMKPHAPSEFRGEFDPIATNVTGIKVDSAGIISSFLCGDDPRLPVSPYRFQPDGIVADASGNVYIGERAANSGNARILRVDASTSEVTVFAGAPGGSSPASVLTTRPSPAPPRRPRPPGGP